MLFKISLGNTGVVRHPIGTLRTRLTNPEISLTLPSAIFSTLQSEQNLVTKPFKELKMPTHSPTSPAESIAINICTTYRREICSQPQVSKTTCSPNL